MALDMISTWWAFAIGLSLYLSGRHFEDYPIGISGGMLWFLLGIYVLINPISDLGGGFLNTIVGSILFLIGGYIFIVGSLEVAKDKGFWDF